MMAARVGGHSWHRPSGELDSFGCRTRAMELLPAMRRRFAVVMYALAAWSLLEGAAEAGMPSPFVTVEDLARLRIQSISFFLATFLASAWLFQRIWNGLIGD